MAASDSSKNGRRSGRAGTKPAGGRRGDSNVGKALRSAYEEAVLEDVPQEMLDLLGKLN